MKRSGQQQGKGPGKELQGIIKPTFPQGQNHEHRLGFPQGSLNEIPPLKMTWKSSKPVWTPQWTLTKDVVPAHLH